MLDEAAFEMISKAIENKGEQKADITKAQKQDLLGTLESFMRSKVSSLTHPYD